MLSAKVRQTPALSIRKPFGLWSRGARTSNAMFGRADPSLDMSTRIQYARKRERRSYQRFYPHDYAAC